jgi:hypothetical protein
MLASAALRSRQPGLGDGQLPTNQLPAIPASPRVGGKDSDCGVDGCAGGVDGAGAVITLRDGTAVKESAALQLRQGAAVSDDDRGAAGSDGGSQIPAYRAGGGGSGSVGAVGAGVAPSARGVHRDGLEASVPRGDAGDGSAGVPVQPTSPAATASAGACSTGAACSSAGGAA